MKTVKLTENPKNDTIPVVKTDMPEFTQSNCCYSHDWPYFREPVHPHDYSEDWNLEEEWNEKQSRIEKKGALIRLDKNKNE
jgi:hypothetical protein